MKRILISAAAAALSLAALSASPASAGFVGPTLQAPNAVEQAQLVVRERVVRPGRGYGRRNWRRGRGRFERCRVVRERVYRPNGNVVIRTRRVCR